jgi:ABC-type uncharacterized transport system permease subunit
MNKVTERKRRRREYLRKKVAHLTGMGVSGSAFLASSMAFLGCTFITVMVLILTLRANPEDRIPGWTELQIGLLTMLLSGLSAFAFWRLTARLKRNVRQLAFVAPVTPNTLPADEILVRGAEQPTVQQSEVLLRAAQAGQETAKEELLRVSQE